MSDYIGREAMLEQVERREKILESLGLDKTLSIDSLKTFIKNRPAADVAPVVHGHWIQVDSTKCRCSRCDIIALIALYPHGDKNYCPNCGAKMDGGAVDD